MRPKRSRGAGRVSVHARHPSRPAIAASSGRCASSPASAAPRETNERYKFLLAHGQTGLSVAFDFPTLMGYDSDHPRSEGEVGKCGVAISSLADMETLFDGIPLDQVSTSMTINGPAIILCCFYVAAAEKQGVRSEKLRGTIQNDILKEYMAQHAWCFPIEPALRLIVDCFEWGATHAPQWNTISISGYHIREAGATAAQELAFTLADGFTYVERGIARGLDVDDFAPRLSFFWDIHNDFFEEIAKLRAARRIWARHMHERYGAKDPRSWMHALPLADRRRDAHRAAADEQRRARRLPGAGRGARRHAVAAHQLDGRDARAADRRGGAGRAAHAAGARLRDRRAERHRSARRLVLRRGAHRPARARGRGAVRRRSTSVGGVVQGLETGWFQRKIAESAARQQWEIEQQRRVIVGVNEFVTDEPELDDPAAQDRRGGRDASSASGWRSCARRATTRSCSERLDALREAARSERERDAAHPRLRARVLHAVRDPRGDGGGVRRVPRAGVLLSARQLECRRERTAEWWEIVLRRPLPARVRADSSRSSGIGAKSRALIDLLGLPAGSRILDVPCGQGRHAHLLAEAGFDVDGARLLRGPARSRARSAGTGPTLRYTQGDMRKLPARWTGRFDAVLNLFTSFGFFTNPADDARVIAEFARVLEPGGILVWHGGSRDGVMARFLARDWWKTEDGTMIAHERSFDPLSGVLTIESTWRGTASGCGERDAPHPALYGDAAGRALRCAGLIVEEAFDGWTTGRFTHVGRDAARRAEGRVPLPLRPCCCVAASGRLRVARTSRFESSTRHYDDQSAYSSPSPGSTATTAAPRSSPRRCAMPAWRSSTPGCIRRPR